MHKEMKNFRLFDEHYICNIHPEHGKYNVCSMFLDFREIFIYLRGLISKPDYTYRKAVVKF